MIRKNNYPGIIISVESRKGGVGKTTAALCLAKRLLEMKYAVLVLDLDVTGTDAADIANSPFWKSNLHIIQKVKGKDEHQTPENLITLFDLNFMAGKMIPSFSAKSPGDQHLRIDLGKINVLGSQIYSLGNDDLDAKTNCIANPGILFDDLHTIWFLEFVKQICKSFETVALSNQKSNYAIVLDNSAGFVSISRSVQEWLTDRGPNYGKFVIVTSLDSQDLLCCERAIVELHDLYQKKWNMSRKYMKAKNPIGDDNELEINKEDEIFFMRLASTDNSKAIEDDPLSFYRVGEQKGSIGQKLCDHPDDYIAAIINRVPRAFKEGNIDYRRQSNEIFSLAAGVQNDIGWPKRMISYDEYIENQFLMYWLHRDHKDWKQNTLFLQKILDRAERALTKLIHKEAVFPNEIRQPGYYERFSRNIKKANEIVTQTRSAFEKAGMGHLSRLIHDEWLPGNIVPSFQNIFSKVLRNSEFPYFESELNELGDDDVNSGKQFHLEKIENEILSSFQENFEKEPFSDESQATFLKVLSALVSLSLTSPLRQSDPGWHRIYELFASVLAIEMEHWRKMRDGKGWNSSIQRFLAQEEPPSRDIQKDSQFAMHSEYFSKRVKSPRAFADFYKACTSAQARIIDYVADSRFLLQLLRYLVNEETQRGNLFPYVKGIAEDVIVRKTMSHAEAESNISKMQLKANYYAEFDEVIKDIFKSWGIMR